MCSNKSIIEYVTLNENIFDFVHVTRVYKDKDILSFFLQALKFVNELWTVNIQIYYAKILEKYRKIKALFNAYNH